METLMDRVSLLTVDYGRWIGQVRVNGRALYTSNQRAKFGPTVCTTFTGSKDTIIAFQLGRLTDSPCVVYVAVSVLCHIDSMLRFSTQSLKVFQVDTRLHFQLFDRWTRKEHDLKLKQLLANWSWANVIPRIRTNKNLFENLFCSARRAHNWVPAKLVKIYWKTAQIVPRLIFLNRSWQELLFSKALPSPPLRK